MAFDQWVLNQTPASGTIAMWNHIAMLLAAGWTMPNASDGTTVAANQVTGSGAGANGLGNTSAWVQLRAPVGTRQLVIQRGTAATVGRTWWIKYSPAAGFTGGAATVAPTATDDEDVWGTSAAGTGLLPVDGGYRQQAGADSATGSFWMATYPTGGGNPTCAFTLDVLSETVASDTDPVAFYTSTASPFLAVDIGGETATSTASGVKGFVSTTWTCIPTLSYFSASGVVVMPGGLPTNPYDTDDQAFSIPYARRSALAAPQGYKGKSSFLRWESPARTTGDTKGALARLVLRDCSVPWDGVTTPSV